jgi:hypothetical protein
LGGGEPEFIAIRACCVDLDCQEEGVDGMDPGVWLRRIVGG